MATKKSLSLVVDACVARAAGERDPDIARKCLEILDLILRKCHHMVMTPSILIEWKEHESNYATRWRSSMKARKKIDNLGTTGTLTNPNWAKVSPRPTVNEKAAVEKDVHLIEAANAGDRVVVTLDEEFRALWPECQRAYNTPPHIDWISPLVPSEVEILNRPGTC